jgi:hypothetical protein
MVRSVLSAKSENHPILAHVQCLARRTHLGGVEDPVGESDDGDGRVDQDPVQHLERHVRRVLRQAHLSDKEGPDRAFHKISPITLMGLSVTTGLSGMFASAPPGPPERVKQ